VAEALRAVPAFPTSAVSGVTTANARFAFLGVLPVPEPERNPTQGIDDCGAGMVFPVQRTMRVASLLNSRSHSTELAASVHSIQSSKLKLTVENAFCRKGR
jgi:hypothetical protein